MQKQPFAPHFGTNRVLTPAATSASIPISTEDKNVYLLNTGPNICYVRIGTGAQTATTADFPVPVNEPMVLSKGQGDDTLAHISATGTTLNVMTGEGF